MLDAQTANAPSFESVWAIMQENAVQMKEFRESQKETERSIKALTSQMGGLHNKFGAIAEHLVGPGIVERFNNLGYHFNSITNRGLKILDEKGNLETEVDILLENGNFVIAVEVKADVKTDDIKHHVKRLEILRKYRKNDSRKIQGAIAGAIFYPNMKEMALANGFYVLEQSGDTMKMDIPEGFKPKEW